MFILKVIPFKKSERSFYGIHKCRSITDMAFLATSVTWTAPPPAWTATDPNVIRTVDMPVRNGSTQVALGWTYTLSAGLVLKTIEFSINNDGIGQIIHATGDITVFNKNDYRTRFNISSTSEEATLVINKVTESEEAVHQCELRTNNNAWKYRIRVIVTGK